MKTNVKYNDRCECFFDVDLPSDEVDRVIAEVYAEIRKFAKIPGFRPGSAPQDLLEKYHADSAREEVLKRLIPECCQRVIDDKKIDAVGYPEVSDVVFEKGKNLLFKAKIEVRPQIKLKDYKGIKVKSKKQPANEADINQALERLQSLYAQFVTIEEKRPVKKGDYTISDVEGFIDGKPISKKYENMWIEVNKDASLLGIGEKLEGAVAGEIREIDVELPKDYPDAKFAGKKALFKVTVKELKEKKMPNLDDEFAKDLGAEGIADLREKLKVQISNKKEADDRIDMKSQILDVLLGQYKVPVPPSMAKRQFDVMQKHLEEQLLERGLDHNAIESHKKEFMKKLESDAADKVRIYFILNAIAEKEKIDVDESDIESRFESIASSSKQDVGTVKKYYESKGLIGGLVEQMREEKTVDWLLGAAAVATEQ